MTRITRVEHRYRINDRQTVFTCNTIRHIIVYLMNLFQKLETREFRDKLHQHRLVIGRQQMNHVVHYHNSFLL